MRNQAKKYITYTMKLDETEHQYLKLIANSRGVNIKDYLLNLAKQDAQANKESLLQDIYKQYDQLFKNLSQR